MSGPGELLRRAARNRRASAARIALEPAAPPRRSALPPHHANYSALMRSHDRLRTRHLPVQGGAERA